MRAQCEAYGRWVGKTKNASLEMRTRGVATFEVSNLRGDRSRYMYCTVHCGSRAHRWRAMAPGSGRDRLNLFPTTSEYHSHALPNWQWVVPTQHFFAHGFLTSEAGQRFLGECGRGRGRAGTAAVIGEWITLMVRGLSESLAG